MAKSHHPYKPYLVNASYLAGEPRPITHLLPPDLFDKLDGMAREANLSRGALLRPHVIKIIEKLVSRKNKKRAIHERTTIDLD